MSSSLDKLPSFSNNDESCQVEFQEQLSLMATLYKNKTKGTFQEKPACLVVRMKRKSGRKGQMYQGTGRDYKPLLHPALHTILVD
jgi:hypothetical protein